MFLGMAVACSRGWAQTKTQFKGNNQTWLRLLNPLCAGELAELWWSLAHSGCGLSLIQPDPE